MAMLATQISEREYLETSFEGPDQEYVDGELIERAMPDKNHSRRQYRIALACGNRGLWPLPELRVKVSSRRYRIIDVAVYLSEPEERVPTAPPLIAFEILSPEDRMMKVIEKFKEYRDWGVRHIWLVDPGQGQLYNYGPNGLAETPVLSAPELDLEIRYSDLL